MVCERVDRVLVVGLSDGAGVCVKVHGCWSVFRSCISGGVMSFLCEWSCVWSSGSSSLLRLHRAHGIRILSSDGLLFAPWVPLLASLRVWSSVVVSASVCAERTPRPVCRARVVRVRLHSGVACA